jgi:hypothetical protein
MKAAPNFFPLSSKFCCAKEVHAVSAFNGQRPKTWSSNFVIESFVSHVSALSAFTRLNLPQRHKASDVLPRQQQSNNQDPCAKPSFPRIQQLQTCMCR